MPLVADSAVPSDHPVLDDPDRCYRYLDYLPAVMHRAAGELPAAVGTDVERMLHDLSRSLPQPRKRLLSLLAVFLLALGPVCLHKGRNRPAAATELGPEFLVLLLKRSDAFGQGVHPFTQLQDGLMLLSDRLVLLQDDADQFFS